MIDTKNIKTGGGIMATLQPGNQQCKIIEFELKEFKYKEGGYELVMHMEGPELGPEFKGFFINKNNESLGRHKCQVGKVKAGEWAFADSITKGGTKISRDQEILKFMKNLCIALDKLNWLDNQDAKHATIESLINTFIKDKPFEGIWIKTCLAGKEYESNGHINYELFFPKYSKSGSPFELVTASPSKLVKFNETEHIKKKAKPTDVEGFTTGTDESSNDFSLD